MAVICPTVTPYDEKSYDFQLNNILHFAKRIHLDFMDGEMTPKASPPLTYAKWPAGVTTDIHLMYRHPIMALDTVTRLRPHLLIIHAESEGNFHELAHRLKASGIKVGVALLSQTNVMVIKPVLHLIDHVLIFSGDLGKFGGHADLSLLEKAEHLRQLKPSLEIGWDGGINEDNVQRLAHGGVDVLNVGGTIQRAANPHEAYARLEELVKEVHGN